MSFWDFTKIYLFIGALFFSAFFLLAGQMVGAYNKALGRKYNYLDLLFLSLAMGATWPYGIFLLLKGGDDAES